jgi:hypothetical protein
MEAPVEATLETGSTTTRNAMALNPAIVELIRDEIGGDADFADDSPTGAGQLGNLEDIYTDSERGNSNVLRTALICWRRRLFNLQSRSFDIVTEGSLMSRSQRIKFLERRIKDLELLVDTTLKGKNMTVVSSAAEAAANAGAEF